MAGKAAVFISYRRQEDSKLLAERLHADLGARNFDVFLDQPGIGKGEKWAKKLKDEIKTRHGMIVVACADYFASDACKVELELALSKKNKLIIPAFLEGIDVIEKAIRQRNDEKAICLLSDLKSFQGVMIPQFPFGKNEYAEALRTIENALLGGDADESAAPPYRGLLSFREQDVEIFFGREQLAEKLFAKVCRKPMVCVLGASGSGKSSLVYAGLIPRLKKHALYTVLALRPGRKPYEALAGSLVGLLEPKLPMLEYPKKIPEIAQALQQGGLLYFLQGLCTGDKGVKHLLIVIDQLEELYTQCHEEARVTGFLDQLLEVARQFADTRDSTVRIVFTLRGDYYGFVVNNRAFSEAVEESTIHVSSMLREEIAAAIVKPVEKYGVRFEDGLIERIIGEAGDRPGNLALLEFALTRLWEASDKRFLTQNVYDDIGGLPGCIARQAESEYENLTEDQQKQARIVLTSLVRVGDPVQGIQDARKLVPISELHSYPLIRREVADKVIVAFTNARLLTVDSDLDNQGAIVEVAHEAVFRTWGRLRDWLNSDRENLLWLQRIHSLMLAWRASKKSESLLVRGNVLKEAEERVKNPRNALISADLQEFIERSVDLREKEAKIVADSQIELLLTAQTADVTRVLKNLQVESEWIRERLREILAGERAGPHAWRILLALLPREPARAQELKKVALEAPPDVLALLRDYLAPFASQVVPSFWEVATSPAAAWGARLRAAFLLATYDPLDARWKVISPFICERLLNENIMQIKDWVSGFRPVKDDFLGPLTANFADVSARDSRRETAVFILCDWFGSRADVVCRLLCMAPPQLYDHLYLTLQERCTDKEEVVACLRKIAGEQAEGPLSEEERVVAGRGRACAALTLLRIEPSTIYADVFAAGKDPEPLFQLIHGVRSRGLQPGQLASCLQRAEGAVQRYAFLSALGEFGVEEVPPHARAPLLNRLAEWHRSDPSSGIHGISGWLLKRWGQGGVVNEVRRTPLPFDLTGEREWFVDVIGDTPLSFTFVVFEPGEFLMGSPPTEADRREDERQHPVRIGRRFAVADREVARQVFQPFLNVLGSRDFPDIDEWSPSPEHPIVGLTWFEAVEFCRWLTTQAGLDSAQQSFSEVRKPARRQAKQPSYSFDPARAGYRLPTEAEWEYACRSRSETTFNFGSDRSLVDKYGWCQTNAGPQTHIPGQLRPNVRGLYNMHGNTWEWCYDWRAPYPEALAIDPTGPETGIQRTLRGGSWTLHVLFSRSACRNGHLPTNRNYYIGLRVVKTV